MRELRVLVGHAAPEVAGGALRRYRNRRLGTPDQRIGISGDTLCCVRPQNGCLGDQSGSQIFLGSGPGCHLGCCQPQSEPAKPGQATNSSRPEGFGWNSTESSSTLADERAIVLGGFNQSIPRQWAPEGVYGGLIRTVEGFETATEGNLKGVLGPAIGITSRTRWTWCRRAPRSGPTAAKTASACRIISGSGRFRAQVRTRPLIAQRPSADSTRASPHALRQER